MSDLFIMYEALDTKCNIETVLNYCKIKFIQAPLEAALTVFLAEGFLIYSQHFSDIISIESTGIFLLPVVLAVFVCFIFIVGITWYILKNFISISTEDNDYKAIHDNFKIIFRNIHIIGVLCYIGISIVITVFICFTANVDSSNIYKLSIFPVLGIIFGFLWNIRGFWGDQRVDWGKVFKEESVANGRDIEIRKLKFSYTIKHIIINCFSIFILLFVFAFAAIAPRFGTVMHSNLGNYTLSSHGLFVFSFFSVFISYIKILFPLFYSNSSGIYLDFKKMI